MLWKLSKRGQRRTGEIEEQNVGHSKENALNLCAKCFSAICPGVVQEPNLTAFSMLLKVLFCALCDVMGRLLIAQKW